MSSGGCALAFLVALPPPAGAHAIEFCKHSAEMALVRKATDDSHLRQSQPATNQQFLRALDALSHQPLMRRDACGPAKRPRKIARRQAALLGKLCDRGIAVEMSRDEVDRAT